MGVNNFICSVFLINLVFIFDKKKIQDFLGINFGWEIIIIFENVLGDFENLEEARKLREFLILGFLFG